MSEKLQKYQTFIINIAILEGRHLAWLNMDSVVIVKIDNKKKCTSVVKNTDCPFYNEYFVFEFFTTFRQVIDKQITVTVIQPRNIWRKRKILGYVMLDVATVWQQDNHQFYHKWAILNTPKSEIFTGNRGYIKMDISVLCKGQVPRFPVHIINDEIDGNFLLPAGIFTERQKCKYVFNIYRCQYLVKKPTSTIIGDYNLDFVENSKNSGPTTFVELMFAGVTVRTSTKKRTSFPVFNEKLLIIDLFPPLCQTVRIELCLGESMKKKVHSFKSINLKLISNDRKAGFLPTFGPTVVHLYTSELLGGYGGSIIMSMNTELEEGMPDPQKNTLVESIEPLNEKICFQYEGITLFSYIHEITAINKKYSKSPVSIKMTFGRINVQKKLLPSGDHIATNSTCPQKPKKINRKYFYLEIDAEKPCLWITEQVPFFKERIYNSNILSRITENLRNKLRNIELLFMSNEVKQLTEEINLQLLDAIDYILTAGRKYIDIVSTYSAEYQTKLDKERRKMCLQIMQNIVENLEDIFEKNSRKRIFRKLQKHFKSIESLVKDVQECWPDVFIWIEHAKKKIACCRIPARHIIYSPIIEERGDYCGSKKTFCFYANERNHKNLLLKLDVSSFLCLDRHQHEFMNGIPSGFTFHEDLKTFPNKMVAEEKHIFQLRAYIFQGKISYGFDKTGLADASVRIIMNNEVKETQVIYACLNPIWNETLIFENKTLYGSKSYITSNPQTILVECFDKDEFYKTDFIGRAVIEPILVLDGEDYSIPKLKWTELYLHEEVTAEILAAFELIEITEGKQLKELKSPRKHVYDIPTDIRPDLIPHKMEVLFWGVRDLRRVNLLNINRPRISVYCGDVYLNSDTLESAIKNPNFIVQVESLDVVLPTQKEYTPPLRIKIYDSRRFGVYVFAGVHITHISSFLVDPMRREERHKKLYGTGHVSFESMESKYSVPSKIDVKTTKDGESDIETEQPAESDEARSCFLIHFIKKCLKLTKKKKNTSSIIITTYEQLPQQDNLGPDDNDWWTKFYRSIEPLTSDENNSKTEILKLQIYGSELENQSDFGGFSDMLRSFELYKGKRIGDETIDEEKITATFKGNVKIYHWPEDNADYVTDRGFPLGEGYFKNFPDNHTLRYLLRVYCVRGLGLRPKDINGKSDPYLHLTLNDKIINDKEHFLNRQVNPIFGRCFEFDAIFPNDNILKIAVWDRDLNSSDDLIGETYIDLEIRFYTKHRARCGIAENYRRSGYCAWRENIKPTAILAELCRKWNIDAPEYDPVSVRIGSKDFVPETFSISDDAEYDKEVLALNVLRRWKEVPLVGFPLVPEHVETRSLYNPGKAGIEQGKLQLWLDIFPIIDLPPPEKVNITPRKPNQYELRVIIWNTEEVLLDEDDFFPGERKSDIYVKCWLEDSSETQYTDVHYRSLTGEGNFNWRFVFQFGYLPAENKLVVYKKESVFASEKTEYKIPCVLTVQVWDNDIFSKDDFLGTLTLELSKMYRPAKDVKKCDLAVIEQGAPTINLFKMRRIKGWWPFRNIDPVTKDNICTGKLEAEMEILSMEDAVREPAGLGRHEPQALSYPNRPNTSFLWFKNPLMAFKHIICKHYRWRIIRCTIVILMGLLLMAALYAFPGYSVKKILGA